MASRWVSSAGMSAKCTTTSRSQTRPAPGRTDPTVRVAPRASAFASALARTIGAKPPARVARATGVANRAILTERRIEGGKGSASGPSWPTSRKQRPASVKESAGVRPARPRGWRRRPPGPRHHWPKWPVPGRGEAGLHRRRRFGGRSSSLPRAPPAPPPRSRPPP